MTDMTDPTPPTPPPFQAPPPPPAAEAAPGPAPLPPLPEKLDPRTLFEALLRRPADLVLRLAEPGHGALGPFLGIATLSMIVFGVVLGCFAMGGQLWAAPLKITAGLLISSVICFPSLYIFCCLAGSRATASQLAATFAGMLALAGILLLGFAPAVWIFTQATNSYGFMGLLALAPWFVALIFGFRFLRNALRATGANARGPLVVWSVIFLLVTLQMTTSLRPILGRSDRFLTSEKRFFLEHWMRSIDRTLPSSSGASASAGAEPSPGPAAR